jgi:ABC-type multidrug transport system ATPase subunit
MALVQLFAIIAATVRQHISDNSRKTLESYLDQHLNAGELEEYLKLFDELTLFHQPESEESDPELTAKKTAAICQRLKNQLTAIDRILVFVKFVEFINQLSIEFDQVSAIENPEFLNYLEIFRTSFNLEEDEYHETLAFITNSDPAGPDSENILVISSLPVAAGKSHGLRRENLAGTLVILHIPSVRLFLCRYLGNDPLFLNGTVVHPNRSLILQTGAILKNMKIAPVYYTDIASVFHHTAEKVKVEFTVKEIEYRFSNNAKGLHPFSFTAHSGELIGVMGGSGVGKSTLLNVLNGSLKPFSGEILINGHPLAAEDGALQGMIGFVPQDDLLIEELTVFQNLWFNAKLCFRDLDDATLETMTRQVLTDIGLAETSHLTVGDPINKFISGGQRKRLNIALELIRQPAVLFADEPTSGLSSMDSEMVMLLLKEQTLDGRLVIVNIHQPSSDIFKLFDKLLIMDKGGYPTYYGNPIDALNYFKTASNYVNPYESECGYCGYVNPELLLQITESKIVNEYGKFTGNRKTTPAEWYGRFRKLIQPTLEIDTGKHPVPASSFKIPGISKQFQIFSVRNALSKLTNRQYILINLLEAPFLAGLLAWLTRYKTGDSYQFGENMNLVAYLFMSVVVSLFLGMMVSAEEIIKDRRLLKREAFLHLSWFSYLNSKILFLFGLSAIQSMLYVVTGNLILGIHGMTLSFWIILFTTTCFANIVGLNISSGLNSVVAIYILIPFILVPQLLLSGTVVSFDNLNPSITSKEQVPVIGNLMASRWAYEALAVEQFRQNEWERPFFRTDMQASHDRYITGYLLPHLRSLLDEMIRNKALQRDKEINDQHYNTLKTNLDQLSTESGLKKFFNIKKLEPALIDDSVVVTARLYLDSLSAFCSRRLTSINATHDAIYNALVSKYGKEVVYSMQKAHANANLADLVRNIAGPDKIITVNGHLVRKYEPIFIVTGSACGNAQFYAPYKQVGGMQMDTLWFNIMVIWTMTILLFFTLWHDSLRKGIDFFSGLKFSRGNRGRSGG